MFTYIKNGIVQLQGDTMHYIRFGRGGKNLISCCRDWATG